eukprot:gnl/TRDRNA2_/TRDRNA2_82631_c0_seq1.p1 gnl/TRDRNA2_/TRDRNA2_82631_c0~~gnl/TRDRNA2_/TRDRNA2_82631_c0_seq1.p1  ORF type:complete len:211 (+),score=12.30 gnl/TRDRNA2_/TRDRNA2_82631_c0_seq1:20-652(+)
MKPSLILFATTLTMTTVAAGTELVTAYLQYFEDGRARSYDWMAASCSEKGAWLCTEEVLCPHGKGKPPVGGARDHDEMWVPTRRASDRGVDWLQVGRRATHICYLLSDGAGRLGTSQHCGTCSSCSSWCTTDEDVPYKGVYACCSISGVAPGEVKSTTPAAPAMPTVTVTTTEGDWSTEGLPTVSATVRSRHSLAKMFLLATASMLEQAV